MALVSTITKLEDEKARITAKTIARDRLNFLYDDGIFTELDSFTKSGDSMASVITAYGYVAGSPVYAFSQDITVNKGALGEASAKKLIKLYDLAAKTGVPVVGIYDSFGALITDGVKALSAYGELLKWVSNLSGVVPQISVVAGTCASTAAMLATSADFVIMAKDAQMYISPNSEESVGNYAENAAKTGTAHIVCDDDKASIETARRIISRMPMNNLSTVPLFEYEAPAFEVMTDAYSTIKAVADAGSIIEICEKFGDAGYTALASLSGATVGFVATNKTDAKLTAKDCSKIGRFVRTCDAFAIPIITFVDTQGFDMSVASEADGSLISMTKLAHSYAEATTAKIAVVSGKAYGSAYIAMAGKGVNADLTYAFSNAIISPLDPETAVEFLMHDELKGAEDVAAKRALLASKYANNEASAFKAAEENCIEDIINPHETRTTLITALEMLAGKRQSRMPKKHSNMPL